MNTNEDANATHIIPKDQANAGGGFAQIVTGAIDAYELMCQANGTDFDKWPIEDLPYAAAGKFAILVCVASITFKYRNWNSIEGRPKLKPLHLMLSPEYNEFLPLFKRICRNFVDLPEEKYDAKPYILLTAIHVPLNLLLLPIVTIGEIEYIQAFENFWSETFLNLFCNADRETKPKTSLEDLEKAYAMLEGFFRFFAKKTYIQLVLIEGREDQERQHAVTTTNESQFITWFREIAMPDLKAHVTNERNRVIAALKQVLEETTVNANVDGYTLKGRNDSTIISNTKLGERSFFSDSKLCELFDAHKNTIYNWRTHKSKAPEGFAEAFERKSKNAMQKVADKYKACHDYRKKCDALNNKKTIRCNMDRLSQ